MTKKHFIELADTIRHFNAIQGDKGAFTNDQIAELAKFCQRQNFGFKVGRWLDYIEGKCGKNGGKVRE